MDPSVYALVFEGNEDYISKEGRDDFDRRRQEYMGGLRGKAPEDIRASADDFIRENWLGYLAGQEELKNFNPCPNFF